MPSSLMSVVVFESCNFSCFSSGGQQTLLLVSFGFWFFSLSFKDQTKSAVLLFPGGFYQDKIMSELGKDLLFFCSGALAVSTEGHSSSWKRGGVCRFSIQISAVLVHTSVVQDIVIPYSVHWWCFIGPKVIFRVAWLLLCR